MDDRLKRLSKTLAYVLRHQPDSIGIELDAAGWIDSADLMLALSNAGHQISAADLDQIISGGDKQRYELSEGRIRAAQGHSVPIELGLEAQAPPEVLFHGTVGRFLSSIRTEGLLPGDRTHVHLSADVETANAVGQRRGKPIVLEIAAGQMQSDGHKFWLATNGVWLVDHVPPQYLK